MPKTLLSADVSCDERVIQEKYTSVFCLPSPSTGLPLPQLDNQYYQQRLYPFKYFSMLDISKQTHTLFLDSNDM